VGVHLKASRRRISQNEFSNIKKSIAVKRAAGGPRINRTAQIDVHPARNFSPGIRIGRDQFVPGWIALDRPVGCRVDLGCLVESGRAARIVADGASVLPVANHARWGAPLGTGFDQLDVNRLAKSRVARIPKYRAIENLTVHRWKLFTQDSNRQL